MIKKMTLSGFRALNIGALALVLVCVSANAFSDWKYSFNEEGSVLSLETDGSSGKIRMEGKLKFFSKKDESFWTFSNSRDAVKNRLAIVDAKGDVQAYAVFPQKGEKLTMLFYHRTAQSFEGKIFFEGTLFVDESDNFPCSSSFDKSGRVLGLSFGAADSLRNDGVFMPQSDTMLRFGADGVIVKNLGEGKYEVKMQGDICLAPEISFEKISGYFKNSYVPYYSALDRSNFSNGRIPTGWMSWNTYFDKATAEDNLAEARIGKKYLQAFGCEIWSIESWQGNSDKLPVSKFYNMNLETNENQFPEGMKKLSDDIRKLGFRPGIWMAPFGTGNEDFYKKHKSWFLHDKNGNPIKSWNGVYTLDPTVAEAREHLSKIFETASRDWGYEFFKIDGMSGRNKGYCAHLYERPEIRSQFADSKCENPFELCVKAFRKGIGKDRIFLACQGHTSGPEAAYAELSRTGADIVSPNKPVLWKNILNQARCTINQSFTNNISMVGDPDTLLVKDLETEQARVTATIVALPGQLTFFGDKLATLDASQMKILQQTLPAETIRPMNLRPLFSMAEVWNLSVRHSSLGQYNVVALFNWGETEKEVSANALELGVEEGAKYLAFEFWTQSFLGCGNLPLKISVPARGVRIVVLKKAENFPQWLGSDRHLAQTGLELEKIFWKAENKTLEGSILLVEKFPLEARVAIPEGFTFDRAECEGASLKAEVLEDGSLNLKFVSDSEKNSSAKFRIKFK